MSGAKNWCFTLNNYTENDENLLELLFQNGHVNYIVFGREIGEEGTPHLQGFVQFKKKLRLRQAKSFISPRCHLEPMAGTATQASMYCKKDGDFQEFGNMVTVGMRDLIYFRLIMSE